MTMMLRAMPAAMVLALLLALLPPSAAAAEAPTCDAVRDLKQDGPSRKLALMLHAFTAGPDDLLPAMAQLRAASGPTDVLLPQLPLDTFSRTPVERVVADLVRCLDAAWATGRYDSLVLVGHSMGSLLARKVYVVGMGESEQARFEPALVEALGTAPRTQRPWAAKVTRIVLLAGINRGWTVTHHMSFVRGLEVSAGLALNRAVEAVGMDPFTVMAGRQGSPFVTHLRLQWLALLQERASQMAPVVQLLGTRDDLVPPEANIDAVTGSNFTYLELRQSGHADVVEMMACSPKEERDDPALCRTRAMRAAVFGRALQDPLPQGDAVPASVEALRGPGDDLAVARPRDPAASAPPATPDQLRRERVRAVVFVIHGIRDEGYWTDRIGATVRRVLEARHGPGTVHLETSSYGYFPMLSFLQPGARQEKVEWLMDRYTEARARYPNADFHYIGHSHGTYLLRKAMRDYEGVRFKQVVLAGSVLPTCVEWAPLIAAGRVERILNFTASADWVVAFFPNAMEMMRWQDLGGAGHRGFGDCEKAAAGQLVQVVGRESGLPGQIGGYLVGSHSAALDDRAWDGIAAFVSGGTLTPEMLPPFTDHHQAFVGGVGGWAPVVWLLGIAVLLGVLWLLWRARWAQWIKTLAIVAYLALVWTVLTRV